MAPSPAVPRVALPRDRPLPVAGLPFFYGWAVWGLSTLGVLMSVPGQTMGMAVFTDIFIRALDLTRTELSTAYLIGTLGSAAFLTYAGRLYDRLGARRMVPAAAVLLALVLLYLSGVDRLSAGLAGRLNLPLATVAFPLITLGYFGVRMMGQGVLFSSSRNVMLVWFHRRLGLVSSLHGACVSLGFSAAPLLLFAMIAAFGWRGALWALAVVVGLVFATVAALFLRNRPEDIGSGPDGMVQPAVPDSSQADQSRSGVMARPANATLAEARRDPLFWLFALALSVNALFGTALTFHIVSIFAEAGRGAEEALGYFIPSAVVALTTNLLIGWQSDRISLKPVLVGMLAVYLCGLFGLLNLATGWGYWLMIAGTGTGMGMWGLLTNLTFIRLFGTRHLGAISGQSITLNVTASAIGPILFSIGLDLTGSYGPAIGIGIAIVTGLLVWAVITPQHGRGAPPNISHRARAEPA